MIKKRNKKLLIDPPINLKAVSNPLPKDVKFLTYDIETAPMAAMTFRLGKQIMRHNALMKGYFNRVHIMSISYKWAHEKKVHTLTWGNSIEDEIKMVEDFVEVIKDADITMGKNNCRFDDKHITTNLMVFGLTDQSLWTRLNEDLESQMRRAFNLGSYTLDYISDLLGLGGKNPMEWSDWKDMAMYRCVNILDHIPAKYLDDMCVFHYGTDLKTIKKNGKAASKKMFTYGDKDVMDTETLWQYCFKYFTPKHSFAENSRLVQRRCYKCGSTKLKRGKDVCNNAFITFHCEHHGGYAGRARYLKKGGLGKMIK